MKRAMLKVIFAATTCVLAILFIAASLMAYEAALPIRPGKGRDTAGLGVLVAFFSTWLAIRITSYAYRKLGLSGGG